MGMKDIILRKQFLISLMLLVTASVIVTIGDYISGQNSALHQSESHAVRVGAHLSYMLEISPGSMPSDPQAFSDRIADYRQELASFLRDFDLADVSIQDKDGKILFSIHNELVGRTVPRTKALLRALAGETSSQIARPDHQENLPEPERDRPVLGTYFPVLHPDTGEVLGVYVINQDYLPLRSMVRKETLRSSMTHIVLLLVFAFLFFRYGSLTSRLLRKDRESHINDLEDRVEERTVELKRSRIRIDDLLERTESMYRELKIAEEYQKNFMGLISHELRTPLTVIKGYLNLLDDGVFHQRADEAAEAVKTALEETRSLETIINNIIELSQLDQEKGVPVSREPIDLSELFQDSIALLQSEIDEKATDIRTEIDPAVTVFHSDRMKILEVVHQLLSNAIKYSSDKGTVLLKAARSHRGLLLSIQDSGVGIPQPQLNEIFNRFYQVDITSTRSFEGSGLGLAIVKRIAELMEGRVWVESEEGAGSTFHFEVPDVPTAKVDQESVDGTADRERMSIDPHGRRRTETILAVDDDPDYLNLLENILKTEGYRIHPCRSGLEGLNYLYSNDNHPLPSLILLDMRMPHVHGIDFCHIVRRNVNTRSIPIIFVSAAAQKEDISMGIAAGANAYMTKPFEPGELIARIDFYLREETN